MHYYQHHISDFNNATRHLTRVERSLYRDLIELYYDKEKPLTSEFERLCRLVIASTTDEVNALIYVLSEFFTLEGDVYVNKRCDEEIEIYHSNSKAKRKAGLASAAKRQQNSTGVEQVLNKCSTNHEPLTSNHKPVTINQKPETIDSKALDSKTESKTNSKPLKEKIKKENPLKKLFPDITEKTFNDFVAHRKNKKALITETAVDGLKREAVKAGVSLETALIECCLRGWIGFKAEWYQNQNARASPSGNPQNRDNFNRQHTEIAKQKLFGNQPQEKDISNETTAL